MILKQLKSQIENCSKDMKEKINDWNFEVKNMFMT